MLLNLLFIDISAQSFNWSKAEGLWAYDYGYGIANDNAGNVYVTGKYELDAVFDGTTVSCLGNHDIFLAKYAPSGVLDWVRTAGCANGDYARAVAVDGANNLIVTGEVEGYGDVVSFSGSSITVNCIGDNDIFIAKYDMNGNLLWAKIEGWYLSEKGLSAACDASGNIFICGYFTDTTMIGGTTYYSEGFKDMFVAKYDPNGNFLWAQVGGSTGRDEAVSLKCDAAGNVYVCGFHKDGAVFGSTILTSGLGNYDIFLAKYNSAGVLQWVKSPGSDYDDLGWGVTVDNAGMVYITGEFTGYALFDAIGVANSSILGDGFVACYDASGNAQWVSQMAGTLADRPRGMGTDGTNIYITGQFGGTAILGSSTITAVDSSDVFMAALNSAGTFLWATSVGGMADSVETLGYEAGNAICAEASGSVYATGSVLDGGTFGSTNHTGYSRTDVFVTKISQAGVGVLDQSQANTIQLYPNPNNGNFTIDLSKLSSSESEMLVYNYLGQIVETRMCNSPQVNIDMSAENKGIYFIKITSDKKTYLTKMIVQ